MQLSINQIWRDRDGDAWQITALQLYSSTAWSTGTAGSTADADLTHLRLICNKLNRRSLQPLKSMQGSINDALLAQIRNGQAQEVAQ